MVRDNLILRMRPDDWEAVLRTNLDGAYHCIKQVLPGMVRQRTFNIRWISGPSRDAANFDAQPDRTVRYSGAEVAVQPG